MVVTEDGLMGLMAVLSAIIVLTWLPAWCKNNEHERRNKALFEALDILKLRFVAVFWLASLADWLQGPYAYKLYSFYDNQIEGGGYLGGNRGITWLFLTGFVGSMTVGTYVGGLADKYGRKRFTILFCVLYALAVTILHVDFYPLLLVGRVLSGTATSLLFSVPDSWIVAEYYKNGGKNYPKNGLSHLFGTAYFGHSIMAILAGWLAQRLTDQHPIKTTTILESPSVHVHWGGYAAPFAASAAVLMVCALVATFVWGENFGHPDKKSGPDADSLSYATKYILAHPKTLLTGLITACFEGSMYCFVFVWTPVLEGRMEAGQPAVPLGLVFSAFMVSCLVGSQVFSMMAKLCNSTDFLLPMLLTVGAVALGSAGFYVEGAYETLLLFCVFEMCVGMYFPLIGSIKSRNVPESIRAKVYNLFRVPLNAVVLLNMSVEMSTSMKLFICALLLTTAMVLSLKLSQLSSIKKPRPVPKKKQKKK